jgi:D-serine deaminase-like pyridoxal phosphate-dependent protein
MLEVVRKLGVGFRAHVKTHKAWRISSVIDGL